MMIKRAKSGYIEEMTDSTVRDERDPLIKDVLEVPTRSETKIDLDLDNDEDDELAVRV